MTPDKDERKIDKETFSLMYENGKAHLEGATKPFS